jgi:two-component system sensor histidine kinase DesK
MPVEEFATSRFRGLNNLEGGNSSMETRTKGLSPYLLWLIWIIWLPFLTPAFMELFQAHPPVLSLVLYLGGMIVFIGIYMLATLRCAWNLVTPPSPSRYSTLATWLPIGAMVVLSIALTPGYGKDWYDVYIMTSACVAGSLPVRRAALAVVGLDLLIVLMAVIRSAHYGLFDLFQLLIFVTVVGAVTMLMVRSVITARELRVAREEITRLAVTNERLRIARDLHDLLGHNLSLIALKSELARRLVTKAPERAAIEISDVEQVARTTLQEVREAVAAYRQPTISSELHAARELLAAAGINYRCDGDEGSINSINALPLALEAVLAWTIREGVTNVIRHSHARQCTIRLLRTAREAGVEIIDDGDSTPSGATGNKNGAGGSGLRGLSERVTALGGRCEAAPLPSGGFRLAVAVPLAEKRRDAIIPGDRAIDQPASIVSQGTHANQEKQERSEEL